VKLNLFPDDADGLDVAPIVAGILLLLALATLATTSSDEARGLSLTVPSGDAVETIDPMAIDEVSLTAAGEILLCSGPGEPRRVEVKDLEERLRGHNRPVLLRCDRQCHYDQYTRVKNALLNAGVTTIFEAMAPP
jgi:biopolymer transport protein ExbD